MSHSRPPTHYSHVFNPIIIPFRGPIQPISASHGHDTSCTAPYLTPKLLYSKPISANILRISYLTNYSHGCIIHRVSSSDGILSSIWHHHDTIFILPHLFISGISHLVTSHSSGYLTIYRVSSSWHISLIQPSFEHLIIILA